MPSDVIFVCAAVPSVPSILPVKVADKSSLIVRAVAKLFNVLPEPLALAV